GDRPAQAAGHLGEVRVGERTEAEREEGGRGVLRMPVKEVLEYIARNLVDDPDAVSVTETKGEGSVVLKLSVAPEDMGKVIGKQGRTARAIRDVMRAAGTKAGVSTVVEIVGRATTLATSRWGGSGGPTG